MIAFGAAPYKRCSPTASSWTRTRKKISKSSASTRSPRPRDAYVAQHGADVIRLWIASQDFREDIPVGRRDPQATSARRTGFSATRFRYQLSNLFDFDPRSDAVPVEQMDTLDRWALHQTAALIRDCTAGLRGLRVPPRLPALQPVLLGHALGHLPRHPEGPALHARDASPRCAAPRRPRSTTSSTRAGARPRAGSHLHLRRGVELRGQECRVRPLTPSTSRTGPSPPPRGPSPGSRPTSPRCSGSARRSPRPSSRTAPRASSASPSTPPSPHRPRRRSGGGAAGKAPRFPARTLHRLACRARHPRRRQRAGRSRCGPAASWVMSAARAAGAGCPR